MKKLYILFLLTALPFSGFGQTFNFTNSVDNWDATITGATLTASPTFVAVNLTEAVSNPKIGSSTAGVDGVTNKICAVTLQNLSTEGPTFLRISFAKAAGGRIYIEQDITSGDTGYVTYYFNLTNADWGNDVPENDIQMHFKAAGNANYTTPAGGVTLNIDKIEFLNAIPRSEKLIYEFNTDGDSEGWSEVTSTINVSANVLTITPTGNGIGSKITNLVNSVDADANTFMHIVYKNENANNNQFRIQFRHSADNYVGFIGTNVSINQNMSTFESIPIDLATAKTEWTGITQDIQIIIRNTNNASNAASLEDIIIDRIVFNNSATLSLDDIDFKDDASILIYPNPVQNILNVNALNEIEKIEVFNILGQKVLSKENDSSIDVSGLNKGTYIAKIYQENNIISTKRFIKE
ncbi:T9SS C-terminal target domain-containing protein [Lutibacter sp. HS1-25]|uniref:T9SS type A sorting domain-containing protein n=1 Tax=Lutibacter sp. HS1-25 TaxID=2485000 RepID=UPI001012F397|nr:T9SS type A sorting domain-containing protein [Lutibacter sp. HS1-25]RXP44537.1 T9SS C-terminal target domain-containing protein [Lutibacter sp. HS1-25]